MGPCLSSAPHLFLKNYYFKDMITVSKILDKYLHRKKGQKINMKKN